MKVEEAIASAKSYFEMVFAEEEISEVRLEEVEFDEADHAWLVTLSAAVGFRRSLDGNGRQAEGFSGPMKRSR